MEGGAQVVRILAATVALWVAAPAAAQGVDIDGHGEVPPAFDPDPHAPLLLQAPWSSQKGAWSAIGLLEYADAPVVQYRQVSVDQVDEVPVIDDVFALDLAGRYAFGRRFGLGATLPVFLGTSGVFAGGPALGDLHLWGPIGLLLPDADTGRGFGLSFVPSLIVPTGAQDRGLGDRTAGGSFSLVGGYDFGPLSTDLNLGLAGTGTADRAGQRFGGGSLIGGFGLGVHPAESWGLHLETRWNAGTDNNTSVANTPDDLGSTAGQPTEVFLSFKTGFGSRGWAAAAVGRAANNGVGASPFRAFVGAGAGYEPTPEGAAVVEPLVIRAFDPAGVPVSDARILVGGETLIATGGDGVASLERDPKWRKGVEIRGPFHAPVVLDEPAEGQRAVDVTLPWLPWQVQVRVQDQQGQPVPAQLVATSLTDPEAASVEGSPGALELLPGTWRIEVNADGYGAQSRAVLVEPNGPPSGEVEVVLLEVAGEAQLGVSLVDPQGVPVGGAQVLIDGQPIGTSGAGGLLTVAGLAEGPHALAVTHENFTRTEEPELELVAGDNPLTLTLRRVPGSVKVVARGPGGRIVPDAVARFNGPRRLAPAPLGSRGERIQALGPGDWVVVVTSAEYGVQQRAISVPEDSWELIEVEVVLQPGENGEASLALRVVDADGNPVTGAAVALDGKQLGATSTGGAVKLIGLKTGSRELEVSGEHLRPVDPIELFLVDGLQEQVVAMGWEPGTVRVTARHPEGPVGDAVLRWIGTETLPPAPLGPTGEGIFGLPEGFWTVLGTSAAHGLQQASIEVPPDSRSLHRVDLVMNPDEGGMADLELRVVDAEGAPVAGAAVRLDGSVVGTTTSAGTLSLKRLSVGPREIDVHSDRHADATERVRLMTGAQEREVVLDFAPGSARVTVQSGGEPVQDAIVRFVGPRAVSPSPVDQRGERIFALGPGSWQAVAISAEKGIAQAAIDIATDQVGLAEVMLDIRPGAVGTAALLVRVLDPDGAPVSGADVTVDGDLVGTTGVGGALLAEGLVPGNVGLNVTHPKFQALDDLVEARLTEGSVERIVQLDWEPGKVHVVARDTAGAPVDAKVQLVGAVDLEPVQLGADGEDTVGLRPGAWTVVASTDTLGPERAEVTVTAGEGQDVELTLAPTRVAMTGEAVVIKEQVTFEFAKATLSGDSSAILDAVANAILGNPAIVKVEVQGHTDAIGSIPANQALSESRATAVRKALVARGVPPEKLVARGYGTQRPIADNETDEGRAKNRRVEFEIAE